MKISYRVEEVDISKNVYKVMEITIIDGKRISAYESTMPTTHTREVYSGCPSDCHAYIQLKQNKLL